MNPTGAQLRVLQKGAMRTRLDSRPRKKKDTGYGYGRICIGEECDQTLNHLHEGPYCYQCEDARERADFTQTTDAEEVG